MVPDMLLLATLLLPSVFQICLRLRERTAMESFASGFLEVEDEL
jgi:hypothetical protein